MTINKNETADNITIALSGRLDKLSSPELEKAMKEEVAKKKNIIFDLKDLTYISSAGLRVLLATEKENKVNEKNTTIINVNSDVMDIFVVTGFVYMLDIQK
ncbi:MAG: STAS domain-containing protein [Lachnospiraceae bacterium]|nr:STAS domain-containing protein [Lachnospiraceae bacterium]